MGVLGGLHPLNTPYLPHRHGNPQKTITDMNIKRKSWGEILRLFSVPEVLFISQLLVPG